MNMIKTSQGIINLDYCIKISEVIYGNDHYRIHIKLQLGNTTDILFLDDQEARDVWKYLSSQCEDLLL